MSMPVCLCMILDEYNKFEKKHKNCEIVIYITLLIVYILHGFMTSSIYK